MKKCIDHWTSLVGSLFFIGILLLTVNAQQCCYQVVYDILPGGQTQVNVSGTSETAADSNSYHALVQFPADYMIQGEPTSPFDKITCTKQGQNGYECDTQNYERFFASFILTVPGNGAPTATGQTQVVAPKVALTLFGQSCQQQNFCSDQVAASKNRDSISLGFLGRWPKYVVIIVGVIAGLLLLGGIYYLWKRHNPNNKHHDKSEVTDIITRHRHRDSGVSGHHNIREPGSTLLGPVKNGNKFTFSDRLLISQIPGAVPKSSTNINEKNSRGLFDGTRPKSYRGTKDKNDKNTHGGGGGGNVAVEIYGEKPRGKALGSGLSGSQLPMSSFAVDIDGSVSEVSADAENDFMQRTRVADIKTLPAAVRVANNSDLARIASALARSSTVRSSRGDKEYRDSRSYKRSSSQNLDELREGRREEQSKSRQIRSPSTTRDHNTSSRDHKTEKRRGDEKKSQAEKIMAEANTTSLADLVRKRRKKSKKKISSDEDSSESKLSDADSDNSSDLPIGDRLPLAMIGSPVTSQKSPPQSPITPIFDSKKSKNMTTKPSKHGSGNISFNTKSTIQQPVSSSSKPRLSSQFLVLQNDSEDGGSSNNGGYYESILNDVLNVGDFTGSEISNGSEEIPIGRRLQVLRDEKKRGSGGGWGKSSASEDDEVPIGLRMGITK
ncbi:5606_t:CDS:2 [Ambispora gerdemannii]|uniref:5606_t:CDS:1 n=1 Tax=Ambispora gerdemannii TaxID=144530 RepID=A0A9N8ZHU5_9GLOM|nr:5606_t:CDS:2 [Ambispora gerdemannii]